ncbi:hypothetical protein GpartN1_g1783.t1 [Galdieria partita]|uniref:Uncharacterized protein n=1 Tax=Galdieria partita TaxID=83374 RepID=A0A9C7PU71_9RHOD|nr:hypothetical protein GpartN1_g1783.t1 [Galdieria partita]
MSDAEHLLYSNLNKFPDSDIDYWKHLLSQAAHMEQLLRIQEFSSAANGLQSSIFIGKEVDIPSNPHLSQNIKDFSVEKKGLHENQGQKQDKENARRDSMFSDTTDIETCDIICQEAISALEQNERERQQLLLEIQEERKKYINERKQLQLEIEQLKDERENAEKNQDKWKTEVESLRQQLATANEELEEKGLPSYIQLHKELEKIMELYNNQNETLQQLREEKVKLLQELEEKEASKIELRMKLSNTESDMQLLEKSKARIDSEYERLQNQLVELEQQRKKFLQETETNSKEEMNTLRRKLESQANEKMELIQQLESIREEYKELKSCILQEYEQMKSQYAELASQHNETLEQLNRLRNEYSSLFQENENLHKKNEGLQYRCKVAEDQLIQLEEESQERKRNAGNEESNLSNILRDERKKVFEKETEAMERERQLFIRDVLTLKKEKNELLRRLQQVTSSDLGNKNTQKSGKYYHSAFQTTHYCLEDIFPGSSLLKKASEPSKIWMQKVKHLSHNMKGNVIRNNLQRTFGYKMEAANKETNMQL